MKGNKPLIDEYNELLDDCHNNQEVVEEMMGIIKSLKAENTNLKQQLTWRDVSEELPEESCEVIIQVKDVGKPTTAYFDATRKLFLTPDRRPEFWVSDGFGGLTSYAKNSVVKWLQIPKE